MKPILNFVANILSIWAIAFASCKKTDPPIPHQHVVSATEPTASDRRPVAIAGNDTTLNFPLRTTNNTYEAVLDAKASYDKYGTIVFYSWTQIRGPLGYTAISNPNTDSSIVTMRGGGIYTFRLEIRDNNNSVNYDTVSITVNQKFLYEYDDLSWDSTSGSLTSLSLAYSPGVINGGIGLDGWFNIRDSLVFLCTSNGACENFSEWEKVAYVPYDSISLTDKLFFYTITPDDTGDISMGYGIIYAKKNAGINFSEKVSVGTLHIQ